MKELLTQWIKSCRFRWFSQWAYSYLYKKSYIAKAKLNGVQLKNLPDTAFKKKWGELGRIYESVTLQYYANYTDKLDDIVPESIGRTSIEYVLNPRKFRPYYSDKNMFARICGKDNVPETILCRINGGGILDAELKPLLGSINDRLAGFDRVLLKPTIDSKGGQGIMLFTREGHDLKCDDTILNLDFLLKYGRDFAVQELVKQHDMLASLNETSVNTLRVAVYRSVVDEKANVIASFIRVGGSGMFLDNACAGGKYAGVDVKSGKVANSLRDINGGVYSSQNGIDYTNLDFTIPGWDIIKNKCIEIAEAIPHHRLIAFDMTITNEMKPILIEFNVESYNYGPFMYINQAPLGKFTDEIIEYCKKELVK